MLPEWMSGEKALRLLAKQLQRRGILEDAEIAMKLQRGKGTHLPGFTIFSRGEEVSPYQWCVPRPRTDYSDVLNVYEEYIDRNLGFVQNPGRVARQAVGKGNAISYFGLARSKTRWRIPLVKLVAITQHFSELPVVANDQRVRAELGDWRMIVTSHGCWSNLHNRMVPAKHYAIDVGFEEVTLPSLRTPHPLATYLVGAGVEDEILWLANTVVRAERQGTIPTISFGPALLTVALAKAERRPRARAAYDITGAALSCHELLQLHPEEGLVPALYEAAVPGLCTVARFKELIANPWAHQHRRVSKATRKEWMGRIELMLQEAQCKAA